MKITTEARWSSMDAFMAGAPADSEKSYAYEGPVAKLDRGAQAAASKSAQAAGTSAAGYGSEAGAEHAALTPFYTQEMQAKHAFDPTQINELLTSAEAPLGAEAGQAQSQAEQAASVSRNPAAFTKVMQQLARDKMKAAAGASEGVAAQDVMGALQKQQEGAAGLSGLYGEDVKGQLGAMGVQQEAIKNQIEAGKSGWLQNVTGVLDSVGNLAKGVSGFQMPTCWVVAATYGWDSPRVPVVRQRLLDWYDKSLIGKVAVTLYRMFGKSIAWQVLKHPRLKSVCRNIFDRIQ